MTNRTKIILLFALATALFTSQCVKPDVVNVKNPCNALETAIITNDSAYMYALIDTYANDLNPIPTASDEFGHEDNLETLIDSLNNKCNNIIFLKTCYACIKTYPRQSEIKVILPSGYSKTIDIETPDNYILEFVDIHD